MECEKISSHRKEETPDATFTRNLFLTILLDETDYGAGDVALGAEFLPLDIAVAHKGDLVSFKLEDAVKYIAAAAEMCEHDVAHFNVVFLAENYAVLFASEVRQHAAALGQDDDFLAFREKIGD